MAGIIEFVVEGDPVPQPRPRIYRSGGVRTNSRAASRYKGMISVVGRKSVGGPLLGPLKMELVFVTARPKSEPKTIRLDRQPNTKHIDVDNLIKAVLDALNGIAYEDDCQVYSISAVKYVAAFGEKPHTKVLILPM